MENIKQAGKNLLCICLTFLKRKRSRRVTTLLDFANKEIATIISNILRENAESLFGECQSEFLKSGSIKDQSFSLKQIQDNSLVQMQSLYIVFLNFKASKA